eukprot:TRINITY_DN1600_c0_g3_i1.p1 TRINITY_DN1600_c0_g3~~TRINITY_DN1600_c0_g3_i1.p1  ORF type:complete len:412 (+),score=87.68 TRINITY_DN1600_c0_g3_i1:159-1238(+)
MENGNFESGCRPTCVAAAEKEVLLKKLKQSMASKKAMKTRITELEEEASTLQFQLDERQNSTHQAASAFPSPSPTPSHGHGHDHYVRSEAELKGRLEAAEQWGDRHTAQKLQQEISSLSKQPPSPDQRVVLLEHRLREAQETSEEYQKTQSDIIKNLECQIESKDAELEQIRSTLHKTLQGQGGQNEHMKEALKAAEQRAEELNARVLELTALNDEMLVKSVREKDKTITPPNPVYAGPLGSEPKRHRSCITPPVNGRESSPVECVLVGRHASPLRPSASVNRPTLKLRSQQPCKESCAPVTPSIFSQPLNPPPSVVLNETTADAYSPKRFTSPPIHASSLYKRPRKGVEEGSLEYFEA